MRNKLTILLAEDNDDDAELIERALRITNPASKLLRVDDGEEAISYLERRGKYADAAAFPYPDILVTDLKMPKVSGLDLLKWLDAHPTCSVIPTILLSGSNLPTDVEAAYKLGANSYFHKPINYVGLIRLFQTLHDYWIRSIFFTPGQN